MLTYIGTSQNSILGTCVKAMSRALDEAGCSGLQLLQAAGFNLAELDGPDTRVPLVQMGELWRLAVEATGDPAFGVKLAKYYKHTTFHSLGYGISASSTLREAFERVQRYSHVVSDAIEYQFSKRKDAYHLTFLPNTIVPIESIDALVGLFLRICRGMLGQHYSPIAIELRRPRPAPVDEFEQVWRAPLRFGCNHDCIIFDQLSIERRLDSGNPEVARSSDVISDQYLAQIDRYNLEARVREILTKRLQSEEPTQHEVAEILNVSARTLQRKLSENGTSFKQIWDETRHALALAYLSSPQRGINEITRLLGFSCSSSFTRSFRRWTGQSPSDWRASSASRYLRSQQGLSLGYQVAKGTDFRRL